MKPIIYLMSALMLIATAEANGNGNNKRNKEAAKKAEKEKKDAKDARDKKRNAIKDFLDKKDSNHDGSLSLDEFLVGESDTVAAAKKFTDANKNGDRYLSKAEISGMLGL